MSRYETITQFADRHLSPYVIRGDELTPLLCPICGGGASQDQRTFSINIDEGVYHCMRGTCHAKGRFEELMQHFGETAPAFDASNKTMKRAKAYTQPTTELHPLTEEILSYFASRKISKETLEAYGVAADQAGNIVFPFMYEGKRVYDKYRRPRKPQAKEPKEWQFSGACPILFGMDLCASSQPLIVTEGQIDALSLYEAGIRNVVSVPSGSENLDWIENCWTFLERFSTIILFGDNDDPGRKMTRKVTLRLDEARCMTIENYPERPDGKPCKDANEILYFLGPEALKKTLDEAEACP